MSELSVYDETVAKQRIASDPDLSAFVAANAGAGKTKVLTDRVMRLLLTGTAPTKILCITFTKAAAAEMAERLFKRLGQWALMDDAALAQELEALDQKSERSADELSRARRLFARALETPGGLKIQTIHSFCESLLRRFPIEAGVVPGFAVMEESEAALLLRQILDKEVVSIWREGGEGCQQFFALGKRMDEQKIRDHVIALVSRLPAVSQAVEAAGGFTEYWSRMATLLDVPENVSAGQLEAAFLDQIDWVWLEGAYSALLAGSKRDVERAAALRCFLDADESEKIDCARSLYLQADGISPLKTLSTKTAQKHLSDIEEKMKDQQALLLALTDNLRGLEIFHATQFLHQLAETVGRKYSTRKAQKGLLDFDDLIRKTAGLFTRTTSAWVMYKLDQGLDHILLDEAQDTSEVQWQVVMEPLHEFFSGEGAREENRTAFVVGDGKQSIYSFQGADVELFTRHQGIISDLVTRAGKPFEFCDLALSFRSAPPVLGFVDAVFDVERAEAAARGVSEEANLKHHSNRQGAGGLVELWPLVEKQETDKGNPWDAPVDMPDPDSPETVLARSISKTIRNWLDSKEILSSRGRPIRPGDIMILCKRRGPVFQEIVRALTRDDVPTAGADRLLLKDHIAVLDLMSVLRFTLQTADDLSLAEALKSPLFNFTDDDLFNLGHGRARHVTLWTSLCHEAVARPDGPYARAVDLLTQARNLGLKAGPIALFQFLLESGQPSGWQRFHSRLGPGAREVIEEFLDEALGYEQNNPRSLQGFLQHYDTLEGDLKREMEGGDDLVRIMTVHGSKGLEADIVFIADATYPDGFKTGPFLPLVERAPQGQDLPMEGYLAFSTSKKHDNASVQDARQYAEMLEAEEYRRQFYVAMTRARDRLYICGKLPGRRNKEKLLGKGLGVASWYALALNGFATLEARGEAVTRHAASWGGDILRYEMKQTAAPDVDKQKQGTDTAPVPAWLHVPVAEETPPARLQPSRLGDLEADELILPSESVAEAPVFAPVQPQSAGPSAYTRGNALHLLLERLPGVEPSARREVGLALLQKHYSDIPETLYPEWVSEVLMVLQDQGFADVFGPGSRAEVPLAGTVSTLGGQKTVSGQIDRLIICQDHIRIIDYKTNRPPPQSVEGIPFAYLAQLSLYRALLQQAYPAHRVDCALLWTWQARLMPVPNDMLDHAFVQITGQAA
ncbi:double-strand break repair helicase AddA [Parvularcula sp. IMCC14364]|uniref:double-strand break repair helicase AddA n=1 Tax=Parvularcula sp. IMCC14364 TaxID=3067902 RepID=UPI00274166F3|nr:double-strand break repair helicase AddA [Parvularcula sp. IMCC14364]